jgi:hypothetical protein
VDFLWPDFTHFQKNFLPTYGLLLMNVAGIAGGLELLEWGSSAVQKLNKRQWNDTSVLHSCLDIFDKRIQGKNQINYVSYIRWFAYSHLISPLSAYTGEWRGEASLVTV